MSKRRSLALAGLILLACVTVPAQENVPLRGYIERILDERQRALELQFAASQRALDQAAKALETRLETMNEFRAQINGERALYVRRDQLEALTAERALYVRRDQLEALTARVKMLEEAKANLEGRFTALGIGLSLLVVVVNVVMRLAPLRRNNDSKGKA